MEKKVAELMTPKIVKVGEDELIYQLVIKIAEDRETMIGCVVDKQDKLKGIITPKELLQAVEVREFGVSRFPFFEGPHILHLLTSKIAKDIMDEPVSVKPEDEIEKAIDLMLDKGFYEVPVVDEEGRVIGEINYFSIIVNSVSYLKG
jgi:CBS domain-containing protein